MIRIILVDDHTLVREALRVVLEREGRMTVVAEAGDGETALRMADEFSPDVVVMDVSMPGPSGIETTKRLLARHPGVKVLVLSTYLERRMIQQMLGVGAHGYISKSAAGTELKQGIYSVLEGRSYFSAQVAALMADDLPAVQTPPGKAGSHLLSAREIQVATLLAAGKSAPEIAEQLHISTGTTKVHRRNLMKKLDIHNVSDLTIHAIRIGLILP